MEPTIKDLADSLDDIKFEIEEIKQELAELKLMVQDIIDKLTEERE